MNFHHLNRYCFVDRDSLIEFAVKLVDNDASFEVSGSQLAIFNVFGMSECTKSWLSGQISFDTCKVQEGFQ